jgi:hypothetical protein
MKFLRKSTLFTMLVAGLFSLAAAQEPQDEPVATLKPACESLPAFSHFDFWLGEWNVYTNDAKRAFQGTNSISKHHKNCLIMENWTSAQGGTGSSMNYYDAVEDQWRQLWVAGGYSIDYAGGLDESGAMVLSGKINYYQTGKSHPFRGTWTPGADGSVRQFFEQQNTENGQWTVWFDGLYIKQGTDQQ